jgi:ParB-like chromosome segregation protein Spo0J
MNLELTIDAEFQSLIAPLAPQEFDLLKAQILEQGCLEPICVWKTEDDRRVLLDGHNRYKICTDNKRDYTTRNVQLASREHAKLWILEHQVGRRNLTDDQRAIIWNEIREQRSEIAQAEKLQKARDAKASGPISAKSAEIERPKKDTRAETAKEAKLSESKLRRAQELKQYQPELYEKVLIGELTLRDGAKELPKGRKKTKARKDQDYFCRIGRTLDGVFKGRLKEMLDELCCLKQQEMMPATQKGLQQIIAVLEDVSGHAAGYAGKFKTILRSNKKAA